MSDSSLDYSSIFSPPPPPPPPFAPPPPATKKSDNGNLHAFIVLGAICIILIGFFLYKLCKKNSNDDLKDTQYEQDEVDLESGLYELESNAAQGDLGSEVSDEERSTPIKRSRSTKHEDKKVRNIDCDANYYKKHKKSKAAAVHPYPVCANEGDLESESELDLDDRKISNGDKRHMEFSSKDSEGHIKFSSEDESSSEDETIHSKQSKDVKFIKDSPKYNAFEGDMESGFYDKRRSRSKDKASRNGKSKRSSSRAGGQK
ncbi:hypothetical protein AgCh_007158 [Apium graveolens]